MDVVGRERARLGCLSQRERQNGVRRRGVFRPSRFFALSLLLSLLFGEVQIGGVKGRGQSTTAIENVIADVGPVATSAHVLCGTTEGDPAKEERCWTGRYVYPRHSSG